MTKSNGVQVSTTIRARVSALVLILMLGVFGSSPICALELKDRVDLIFKKWDKIDSPGCALAVIQNGSIVYERGYGMADLSHGIPNTPSTLFNHGSDSKQFTTFAILLLEEEGKLTLEDDIRLYIPEVPDLGNKITIQHLIHHTSGLRDYLGLMVFGGWNLLEDFINKPQTFSLLSRQKALNFDPGDQFMYCNTGYMLLAEIVARISGKTFPEFAQERIFAPLGMTNSQFCDDHKKIIKNLAYSYGPGAKGGFQQEPFNMDNVGESGLISSVEDLALWDQNFYTAKVGSPAIFEKMYEIGVLNNGAQTGYSGGLILTQYNGRKIIYHGGDIAGYHSQILRFPDQQLSVITASNSANLISTDLMSLSLQVANLYFNLPPTAIPNFQIHEPSLVGWGVGDFLLPPPDVEFAAFMESLKKPSRIEDTQNGIQSAVPQMSAESAKEYEGRYYSDELDIFYTVTFDGKANLVFQLPRSQPYYFSSKSVRTDIISFNESTDLKGNFLRNDNNQVIGFQISNPRTLNVVFSKAEVVKQN